MIGVTFGIGPDWCTVARRCAREMELRTGLRCLTIESDPIGVSHPAWLKLRVFELIDDDVDAVMVFDADLLPLQNWDPRGIYELSARPFVAVPDVDSLPVLNECATFGIPAPGFYVNSGLFIAGRHHRPVLDRAFAFHPRLGTWAEQTALNVALVRTRTEVLRLPRTFNSLLWPGSDAMDAAALRQRPEVNLHAASLGGDATRVAELQNDLFDGAG